MNRRQRRAQTSKPTKIESVDDIPLSQPERIDPSEKKSKTLYEIAAEKQAELLPQAQAFDTKNLSPDNLVNIRIGPDGRIIKQAANESKSQAGEDEVPSETIPPVLDTLFLATSLSAIHFTLETLTVHQYAQELSFPPIVKHTLFMALPTLFFLIHLAHGHLVSFPLSNASARTKTVLYVLQQLVYIVVANVSGCYLIRLTNDKGYYAVMKNAPGIGTIWVWSVIEMGLIGALAGVVGPGLYAWKYGYGIT